jgi:hypothetical protein
MTHENRRRRWNDPIDSSAGNPSVAHQMQRILDRWQLTEDTVETDQLLEDYVMPDERSEC